MRSRVSGELARPQRAGLRGAGRDPAARSPGWAGDGARGPWGLPALRGDAAAAGVVEALQEENFARPFSSASEAGFDAMLGM